MIEVELGIRWMHTFTKLPMHVPKINAIIPVKPVSGIFNSLSLYPGVLYLIRTGAKSPSAAPVRSWQTAGFFERVVLSFKKIKIDIVKEK